MTKYEPSLALISSNRILEGNKAKLSKKPDHISSLKLKFDKNEIKPKAKMSFNDNLALNQRCKSAKQHVFFVFYIIETVLLVHLGFVFSFHLILERTESEKHFSHFNLIYHVKY